MTKLCNFLVAFGLLLWARPGIGKANLAELARRDNSTTNRASLQPATCISSPTITLNMGADDYVDFTSPNYPRNYRVLMKCSYLFQSPIGTRLSLDCPDVYLQWFATLFVNDGSNTVRKSCIFCGKDTFSHEFSSNKGEVGLQNLFFFRSRGFSCRMSVISPIPPNNDCNCGVVNRSTRIVGGEETEEHEYPWMAALVYRSGNFNFCGGSLISNQYVMTAAHCTSNSGQAADKIAVRLGIHSKSSYPSTALYRLVLETKNNPNYNDIPSDSDVSLLKIETVDLSSSSTITIRPICLPTNVNNDYVGVTATVAGWGRTSYGGSSTTVLLEVDVPVISNNECKNSYGSSITNTMICAGVEGKDSCQGDSGGPIFVASANGEYMEEIGIVSWGRGCGDDGYPGVYSRVTALLPWILENTADSTTCSPPS